jgi:drug/metabolite transporter (DMT)-like permease
LSLTSFVLVLIAAVLHAGWNALVKAGGDRLITSWAIVSAAAIVGIPVLMVVGLPDRKVWWVLVVTGALHIAYNLFLVAAYERADLAVAYPIARGVAPVIVTIAGITLLDDRVTILGAIGVLLVVSGLGVVATAHPLHDTRWAIATGIMIASYTFVDGYGVRRNGEAAQYICSSFILYAIVFTFIVWSRRDVSRMRRAVLQNPGRLLLGGSANAGAYLLVMIAARTEPLGLVAGLRETSVLFGLVIAHRLLHERVTLRQAVAIVIAVGGAVAIVVS